MRERPPERADAARSSRPSVEETDPQRLRSAAWLWFFKHILARRMRRSFRAVRIARPGLPSVSDRLPLILYANHPSWWDGALLPVLATRLFPRRRAYGPIDAEALGRYGFMRRLGLFGIEPGSYAGAATFLRVGRAVLGSPDTLFCVTPQGRFSDVRERPVRIARGLAGLISAVPQVTVLPVAFEYPFWSERSPEALVRFGEPMVLGRDTAMPLDAVHQSLQHRLVTAMDRLRDDALARDPARFDVLIEGRVGVGGLYDLWRRARAWSHGQRFDPAHLPDEGRG